MTTDSPSTPLTLAARREALVAQCALQRMNAGNEVADLLAPLRGGASSLGGFGGVGMKLPLTIAGVVLGLIVTRAGKAMPMVSAGLSLWRLARTVLGVLRPSPE